MKQLTINIPDYYFATFMEYLKKIPEASLLHESTFVLTEEHLRILNNSSSLPEENCFSREESNLKLRTAKNGQ